MVPLYCVPSINSCTCHRRKDQKQEQNKNIQNLWIVIKHQYHSYLEAASVRTRHQWQPGTLESGIRFKTRIGIRNEDERRTSSTVAVLQLQFLSSCLSKIMNQKTKTSSPVAVLYLGGLSSSTSSFSSGTAGPRGWFNDIGNSFCRYLNGRK